MQSFYKNWLAKNQKENLEVLNVLKASKPINTEDLVNSATSDNLQNRTATPNLQSAQLHTVHTIDFNSSLSNIIFEEGNLQLIIEKGNHIKQRKFWLEDHLFYLKIKNPNMDTPFLRDILKFLEVGFDYIMTQVRKFYNSEEHNVAFLTLYQQPMINGLNTGGFDIQETGSDIVERILKMLEQFLVSNQTLKLDNTFKVFLKVLSINHMKYNQKSKKRIHRKRTKEFYKRKKTYGSRKKPTKKFNYYWAVDVPEHYPNAPHLNIFKDKCLLTATVLGLLQNDYFKSNRTDRRYLYAQNINSINKVKQCSAGQIILSELNDMLAKLDLCHNGPYDCEETTKKLSSTYNCQFFVFDGICNSRKLIYMYPEEYDDKLKPIYLFQPREAQNHLVFIRNYHSYCRANMKVCFGCKKTFLTYNYRHLCPKKKTCFSCRRFFQSAESYIHEKLSGEFCDKNISSEEEFICSLCNVTCYSKHCFKGHKLKCNGKGTFGYKCLKCNKFTYRYGKIDGSTLKEKHRCTDLKCCNFCRQPLDLNHQCKIQIETIPKVWPKLAFIGMHHFDKSSENCLKCFELRSENCLFCDEHSNLQQNLFDDPVLAIIYAEQSQIGTFRKYELNNFGNQPVMSKSENVMSYDLINFPTNINLEKEKLHRQPKITQDFKTNYQSMQNGNPLNLMDMLLQLITSDNWRNTTFICQDEDSLTYVSLA